MQEYYQWANTKNFNEVPILSVACVSYSGKFKNFASSTILQISFNQALTGNSYCTFETVRSSAGSSLFHKADRFIGPSSTWTVQISLDNVDAGMPLA